MNESLDTVAGSAEPTGAAGSRRRRAGRHRKFRPRVDWLETRTLTALVGYTPAQIRHAYGFDAVNFQAGGGSVPGDGRGMTIALFEVGDTPGLLDDLAVFDRAFGLPDPTPWAPGTPRPAGPSLQKLGLDPSNPGTLPVAVVGSEPEAILDVEWAHAVAPAANLLIVEVALHSQLPEADALAARQPGVVVVSNSYSTFNYQEAPAEVGNDSAYTTPPGHPGVTFIDSSGDTGAPSHPPDYSPNVLSVGGTSLTLDASGGYGAETGWPGSGGGLSLYQPRPAYQDRVVPRGVGRRAVPDVAILGNPATGVAVYDPLRGGWAIGGGTSLSAPLWAAIIAIADQGRALRGLGPLDGPTQTLPDLYRLPRRDFHDVLGGSNGYRASRGFDLVTGLGSPYVDRVVAGLVADTSTAPAPRVEKPLRPPASYYAPSRGVLHLTAGSAFNGILATLRIGTGAAEPGVAHVAWGDGTPADAPPIILVPLGRGLVQVRTVLGSAGRKRFDQPGTYRVVASVDLASGATRAIRRTVVVGLAPLTASGRTVSATAGSGFSGVLATFTDANPSPVGADPGGLYDAEIAWGDGTRSTGTIRSRPDAPGYLVEAQHAYRKPGLAAITVTITEDLPGQVRPLAFRARSLAVVGR